MKKTLKLIASIVVPAIAAVILAPSARAAGSEVYSRSTCALGTTTGMGVWTNNIAYSALDLKRIWVQASSVTNATVTINRITADGVYTQFVGSVATATAKSGSTASLTAAFMKYGDMLAFSSDATTGAIMMVEYLIQIP